MRETANHKPFYMTTAIAYTSGKPHIGNTYEIILSDAIARYRREQGYDVRFMTGTDEHGLKIEEKAREEGISPQEYVDRVARQIQSIWDLMNTSYDKFIRTTDPYHVKQVQKIFRRMYDKGDIYKGFYEGWYCTPCESFWTESQLVDGNCPDCGRPVKKEKEEAYFFRMSRYADRLIEYINEHPEFIQPVQRRNEMMNNFLLPGLQDLCVSRTSFKWGIPVDFDEGHVVYVWLDALTNYITGAGFNCDGETTEEGAAYAAGYSGNGEPAEEHYHCFEKYWPADLHVIGKDIVRFHTIYWPIFLMSLELPLPRQVFGHPWLLVADGKMSKSRGNVLYADALAEVFGVDAVRFFVLHEMPFDNDGSISWELMLERYNGDLANILGNLVSRTISMSNKYFGGVVETDDTSEEVDDDLIDTILSAAERVDMKMNELRVADALTEVFSIFRRCNKYIDETTPWILARDEAKKERLKTVLYNLTEGIVIGASLLHSFMPATAEAILGELGTDKRDYADMDSFGLYPNGFKVTDEPVMLFRRMDFDTLVRRVREAAGIDIMAEEGESTKEAAPAAEPVPGHKPTITYDDFAKLEFRVGEIIACEEVPHSGKLLKNTVKIAGEKRTILSGIKKFYKPEDMVGKKVMVVCNLAPRKMAGEMSEGMIIAAVGENDSPISLMVPEDHDMPSGSEIN